MNPTEEEDLLNQGDSWLDDEEAALESFLQEDALLDAIRNAPEMETSVPELEEYPVPDAGSVGSRIGGGQSIELAEVIAPTAASGSSAVPSGSRGASRCDPMDGVTHSSLHHSEGQNIQRFEIEAAGGAGPKERRTDLERGGASDASRAGAPGSRAQGSSAEPSKARAERKFPWQGAALAAATLLWILFFGPDFGMSQSEVKVFTPRAAPVSDPQIRMPTVDEEDDLDSDLEAFKNATVPRRGSVGVEFKSETFFGTNSTGEAPSVDGGNSSEPGNANEKSRRGRRGGRKSEMR